MPELAEAQVLSEQITHRFAGCKLLGIDLLDPTLLRDCTSELGEQSTTRDSMGRFMGQRLNRVERWGKRLWFDFAPAGGMLLSLGMTGRLSIGGRDSPHIRLCLNFEDPAPSMCFKDPRRFARAHVYVDAESAQDQLEGRIGIEADSSLDWSEMASILGWPRSSRTLKAALLDQSRLAGIGNYLADEICGRSRLHPARKINTLLDSDWVELNQVREHLITQAIQARGLSFSDFVHLDGSRGHMADHLLFYGRVGLPCIFCDTLLTKTKVAGRSSSLCPNCQKP